MAKIISIAAQKGGTGKSTTAAALTAGLKLQGFKTLAVDLDPQATLSYFMGATAGDSSSYELMKGAPAAEVIQRTAQGDIIPASLRLAEIDAGEPYLLRDALKPISLEYDYIIIDNAPTLGALLVNGLMAAQEIIIPVRADATALQSIYQLTETIRAAQSRNSALNVAGILVTQYSRRTCLARDLLEVIKKKAAEQGLSVFNTQIRPGVAIQEAQLMQSSLFDYAPKSNPAIDYMQLIKEIRA